MRQHVFDYLQFKCPFGSVPPWKVFVELFVDNLDDLEGKEHNYRALSHNVETLLPFLETTERSKEPHWTPEEASFIFENVQALPRDWTYLCVIRLDREEKIAITWLSSKGQWYCEQDPRTNPAEDDYTITFDNNDDDNEDDDDDNDKSNSQDPASEISHQVPTPKAARMKRRPMATPTRQPTQKKAKGTREKKKSKPVAKASKFVVPSTQAHLDKWVKK